MILPIVAYGSSVLRKDTVEVTPDYEGLSDLINNMFETMYKAEGIGLAAPQVGRSLRLFIVDASPIGEDDETVRDFKRVFINPKILEYIGEEVTYNEGCLSIPGIHESVTRRNGFRMKYFDENFQEHEEVFEGMRARVMNHEYDHLDGIMFTDLLSPLKKRLLKGKLTAIGKGKIHTSYIMRYV